jgi:hypothetical protein
MRRARTPPSTFLFLPIYLSNSPEPRWLQLSETGEPSKLNPRPRSAAFHYHIVIELRRRKVTPCKAVRRVDGSYIVGGPIWSQHLRLTKFIILQCGRGRVSSDNRPAACTVAGKSPSVHARPTGVPRGAAPRTSRRVSARLTACAPYGTAPTRCRTRATFIEPTLRWREVSVRGIRHQGRRRGGCSVLPA